MTWPGHPDDQWIDITALGDTEPKLILGMSGAAREVEAAAAKYVAGQIPFEEFEAVVDKVWKTA